ncbi:methyl-accepting chemotaxis protein [Methylobacterium oryzihabitans]|uniref:Methyl-accepting chemotaxis protein n=1 Tax=Methylobacterium oryzihabitans TaxID=2499852 RepID=A0A437P1H7_9HYPH|nr:methyl-accepting chemotaxis protein [Methylobacterium oryzihabitans]RVU16151.1 methyl-accepting chemotaxis protein [Methylobacterium oryzihabitans]
MSIRYKLLLPLLGFLILAGLLAGATGLASFEALDDVATVAERAAEANESGRAARDHFRQAEEMVAHVTAMTDLADLAPVRARFTRSNDGLMVLLGRLNAAALSDPMRSLAQRAEAEARRWRGDAEVLLGIGSAREVPTQERMARQSRNVQQRFDEIVARAAEDARIQMQAMRSATERRIGVMLGLAAAVVLLGSATAWWLAGTLAKPLVRLTDDTARLARGDTGVQLPAAQRRDEIGDIARAVVAVRDRSQTEAARQIEETQAARRREQEARQAMLRDLAGRFEQTVGLIVAEVAQAVDGLQGHAASMRSAVAGTARRSASAADAAQQTSANVNAVAAAAEEINATVGEIGRQVEQASRMSDSAVRTAARTEEIVAALGDAATRIGGVVEIVSSIAGQTNLLALNATIEAARADESGRGFAVVAAEVKELASQTTRATGEIGRQIDAIRAATVEAGQAIQAIAGEIQSMNAVTTGIAAAVQEQSATTQEIARGMSEASTGTDAVSANIAAVARSATGAGDTAQAVATAAAALADRSGALRGEVEQFLVGVRAA